MHKDFANRFRSVRTAFGSRGKRTEAAEWARELGFADRSFYNWERGTSLPRRRVAELAEIYEPLRARGVDPKGLATWVFTGEGAMPHPTRPATPTSSTQAPEPSATVFFKNTVERIAEEGHDGRKDPKVALALIVELCKTSKLAAYLVAAWTATYVVVGESFSYLLHHRDEGETRHFSSAVRICPAAAA